jgi:hypothetical protein
MLGKRVDQSIDAFVRRQPPHEENAATPSIRVGPKTGGIGSSVHDSRSRRRHGKLARRIGRYREKAVEEPRKQACPVPAAKPVVGDRGWDPADASMQSRQPARRASQLVGMDDVGLTEGMTESEGKGMGGMAAEERDRSQDTDPQATRVGPGTPLPGKADELAINPARERSGELERIPLTAPEDAERAE